MKNNTKNNTKTAETKAKVTTKTTEVKPVTAEKPIAPVAPKTETAKTTETAKLAEAKESVKTTEPKETKTEYKPTKRESASAKFMELFKYALDKKRITSEVEDNLTDREYCRKELKLSYSLLLKIMDINNYKAQRKINGYYRYQSTPIKINGTDYLVCNNIYDKNVEMMEVFVEKN